MQECGLMIKEKTRKLLHPKTVRCRAPGLLVILHQREYREGGGCRLHGKYVKS
jgi:hypothetical protein